MYDERCFKDSLFLLFLQTAPEFIEKLPMAGSRNQHLKNDAPKKFMDCAQPAGPAMTTAIPIPIPISISVRVIYR